MAKRPVKTDITAESVQVSAVVVEAIGMISRNGVDYMPGTVFSCETEEARRLREIGAVKWD